MALFEVLKPRSSIGKLPKNGDLNCVMVQLFEPIHPLKRALATVDPVRRSMRESL
jgi:hypothetical protein